MTERIEAKVARVNSEMELIINKGSDAGVEEDMVFRVKGTPSEVLDPDTGESLGLVSGVKVFVKVREVTDKFSIARTFRRQRVNVGGSGSTLSTMFQPPKYETRVETLRRDPTRERSVAQSEAIVEIGDVVESVLPGEEIENISTAVWRPDD